jgi:hypothetical protein
LDSDPSGDITGHHEICCSAAIDPIYKPSLKSNSDGGQEVFMVRQGEPANQTVKEIAQDVEVEITRVARLAREADKVTEKRHQGL